MLSFIDYIFDLFDVSDVDTPDVSSDEVSIPDQNENDTTGSFDNYSMEDFGQTSIQDGASESVSSMLNNGITKNSISDEEYGQITHGENSTYTNNESQNKSNPSFLGTTACECNLCSCQQYVGITGMGHLCTCGHVFEKHRWR